MNEKIKSIGTLLGGTMVGFLASQYLFPNAAIVECNPTYRINTQQGLFIIPNQASKATAKVRYSIQLKDTLLENTILPTDTITLDFPWNADLNFVNLYYLNDKDNTIAIHQASIGDGIVVEDIIVNQKDTIPQ